MSVFHLERRGDQQSSCALRAGRARRVRLAVVAWWLAVRLDRELATGASPDASPVLAVRARRITSRRSRRRVAHGLARAMRDAQVMPPAFSAAVRPHEREVQADRTVLATLERRLRAPEPVTARGMAMLQVLLTEATSPLYRPGEPGALGSELRAAAAALRPYGRPAART
jgi:hypothetical protein